MVCGINLLYQDVSNGTNCNLDPAIFDPFSRKIFKFSNQDLKKAAHGKWELRPKIIHFLLYLAMEVKKAVGFDIFFFFSEPCPFFSGIFFLFFKTAKNVLAIEILFQNLKKSTFKL